MVYSPSFEEFKSLAAKGNVVPVYRQIMADTLTAVSAFQNIATDPYAFLLESVAGGENIGRYCFLGASPFAVFRAYGSKVEIEEGGRRTNMESANPLDTFGEFLARFRLSPVDGLPRFSCGAVGFMGYDVVRWVEYLPDCPADDRGLPDMLFMFFDRVLIFDNVDKTVKVVCSAVLDRYADLESAYAEACEGIDQMLRKLRRPVAHHVEDINPRHSVEIEFDSNSSLARYKDVVERCKEYILAGDIFQVVPSQRLHCKTKAQPFDIYRALRVVNPSPYMFYLKMGEILLIGASPEVMTRVENRQVTVRPIAGTRPRGKTQEEDLALAEELLADPKERAEHIMLVDLGRNDVGRVSQYGSVKIDDIMVIERYSHVMHIVSNVSGILHEGLTALDALKSCLPAGTLSGAPKVRAMQVIDEMESTKRGPYGGAVGYFDFSGNMDTCITIRTIVMQGSDIYVQAGGGIVADSVPATEYEETLNKARALLRAIKIAEQIEAEPGL